VADWVSGQRPYILGHRGASHHAPENSVAAFALALEQGADGVELDVQLCKDGVPVVYHDTYLKAENGRATPIANLTLAALKQLNIGAGQQIPTLDEVFATFGRTMLYNVEIKDWHVRDKGTETAVFHCIHTHNLHTQCHISSFNPFSLRRFRRLTHNISSGILREKGMLRYSYLLTPSEADHPHHSMIDAPYMAWARQRHYQVYTWTVDDPTTAQRLAQLGVDGIITNKPALIRQALP
jgi:glycerophosphoryl diester phosphodiesterase